MTLSLRRFEHSRTWTHSFYSTKWNKSETRDRCLELMYYTHFHGSSFYQNTTSQTTEPNEKRTTLYVTCTLSPPLKLRLQRLMIAVDRVDLGNQPTLSPTTQWVLGDDVPFWRHHFSAGCRDFLESFPFWFLHAQVVSAFLMDFPMYPFAN